MQKYIFKLFISSDIPSSLEAHAHIKSVCDEYIPGNYHIEIIDIDNNPEKAEEERIMAIPTLIKVQPDPQKRLIGALSVKSRVATGLGFI